ncbi:hypothetical protein BDV24DRAFT_143185 [Aspergillus arachidicola]|uniref:Uncharacterized protein n=1 Tax=Aspergillus arachidicola TaxID=656916 RepID=A0A5N6XS02_9EURO|nr:hypothetical protein BDV24DRAFT_143185 [Aspergillus arachidicola]
MFIYYHRACGVEPYSQDSILLLSMFPSFIGWNLFTTGESIIYRSNAPPFEV